MADGTEITPYFTCSAKMTKILQFNFQHSLPLNNKSIFKHQVNSLKLTSNREMPVSILTVDDQPPVIH
jgi:hypothetical protein